MFFVCILIGYLIAYNKLKILCIADYRFHDSCEQFVKFESQIVLMDIGLPFFNGYHWRSEIRKLSKVPIIFLSSASDHINIVMALNMGGDNFINKPFELDVLLAKIQAMLHRAYDFQVQSNLFEHKGIILNLADASLRIGNHKVGLTKNVFRMVQTLFENKGKVVSREEMMKRLWDSDYFIDDKQSLL